MGPVPSASVCPSPDPAVTGMLRCMDYRMEMLAQIEQHIANGDRCITAQLDMIGYARSIGLDTKPFEATLAGFRGTQEARFRSRDRLLRQLFSQEGLNSN